MVQIINEQPIQPNALGAALGSGLMGLLGNVGQLQDQQAQQGILSKVLLGSATPEEFAQLRPEYQLKGSALLGQQQQEQGKLLADEQKRMEKIQEKVIPLQGALQRVERMREIGSGGRLGRGSSLLGMLGGETAKDRGEYEQLGKSLISFATSIPIRNRLEFETLAEQLYDPSLPDKAREGVLNAMERIITDSINQYVGPQESGNYINRQQESKQERPSLESFYKK